MNTNFVNSKNPYGKGGNEAVKQIIDRVLNQHFTSAPDRKKSIGEIEDEMLGMVVQKAQIVDFAKGETCEFK